MPYKKTKRKITFAGSGFFAIPQILSLAKNYNLEIITQKNYTPVKKKVEKLGIKIYEISSSIELEKLLEKIKPKIMVISDFGIILSRKSLQIPKLTINTHPSLLPKYRGPSPYIQPILDGEKKTGISIIKMTENVDAGPIFLQKKMEIEENENQISLRTKVGRLASKILSSNLEKIIRGEIIPLVQDGSKASYTKTLVKEDGKIDWREPAILIESKIRAFNPWPGTFTFFKTTKKNLRVKILKADIEKGNNLKPGYLKIENSEIKIKTGRDFLVIKKLQPEGKKEMAVSNFLKGYTIKLKIKNTPPK